MTLNEIEQQLPWGFHDAYLARLEVDWNRRALTLDLRVQIGERQETDQLARVVVTGLHYFTADAPNPDPNDPLPEDELPWIDARPGPLNEKVAATLPPTPEGCFLHHINLRAIWQTLHICAREAALSWLEPAPVPSQSGRRAYFPGEELP